MPFRKIGLIEAKSTKTTVTKCITVHIPPHDDTDQHPTQGKKGKRKVRRTRMECDHVGNTGIRSKNTNASGENEQALCHGYHA